MDASGGAQRFARATRSGALRKKSETREDSVGLCIRGLLLLLAGTRLPSLIQCLGEALSITVGATCGPRPFIHGRGRRSVAASRGAAR